MKAFSMVTKSSDPFNKIIVNLFASSVGKSEWCVFGAIKSRMATSSSVLLQHNGGIQVENEEWILWLHRNDKACQMSRRERDELPVMTYQVEV